MKRLERGRWHGAFAMMSALALAACGGGEVASNGDATATAADGQWNAAVAPVGESGVQGTVRITPGGDSLTVKLELLGVSQGETYPARLVVGACAEEPGRTTAELQTPHVGTVGVGSSLTRVGPGAVGSDTVYSVRVAMPDGSAAACGELKPGGV